MIKKKHLPNVFLLFASAFGFVWTVWQHEIMVLWYAAERWDSVFAFFSGIVVKWGVAYDLTLFGEALCFFGACAAIWLWED